MSLAALLPQLQSELTQLSTALEAAHPAQHAAAADAAAAAAAAAASKPAATHAPAGSASADTAARTAMLQRILALQDSVSSVLRTRRLRLPRSYPSARSLHPRAWPFGSEEWAPADEEAPGAEAREREEEEQEEEEEEEEEENAAAGPRACYTEPLRPAAPSAASAAAAPILTQSVLTSLLSHLLELHALLGVELEASAKVPCVGAVNETGALFLKFVPMIVALSNSNVVAAADEESRAAALAEHGQHVEHIASFVMDSLRELDLSSFSPHLAATTHHYLLALEGAFKYAQRQACQEFVVITYTDLVNWFSDAQGAFPRLAFIKLRRFGVSAFLALLYTMDSAFQTEIGSAAFFAECFPLLASPLLTSHLIWVLRAHPAHLEKEVLPLVMRGLLHTKTKSSPSVKTVQMILTALGNVACFSREAKNEGQMQDAAADASGSSSSSSAGAPLSTLPLLAPYMSQLLSTILGTIEKSPSATAQTGVLALARIVLAGFDMEEVAEAMPRILRGWRGVIDERWFVREQSEAGEDYEEDDQDLVSSAQYATTDMLHLLFQSEADAVAAGIHTDHPFNQSRLIALLAGDQDSVRQIRGIVQVMLDSTKKPLFFNDDAALRNSEIHLLKEILAHEAFFRALLIEPMKEAEESDDDDEDDEDEAAEDGAEKPAKVVLPPLSLSSFLIQLMRSIVLAKADGAQGRSENYVLALASLAGFVSAPFSAPALSAFKAAMQSAENKKLLQDIKSDAETWKIVKAWVA